MFIAIYLVYEICYENQKADTNEKNQVMKTTTEINQKNKIALGVAIGFVVGALFGTITGIVAHDIALWLSVGIGSGLAIGATISLIFKNPKY